MDIRRRLGVHIRQGVYFTLAGVGLVGCSYFNLQWLHRPGHHSVRGFVEAGFANSGSSSLSWDLLVGGLAAAVFMVVESYRSNMRWPWVWPVLLFTVAFAFAFPLFLGMREGQKGRNRG